MCSEPGAVMGDNRDRILLTGATGYVGGRLLRRLEHQNLRVRCLTRRPGLLARRVASTSEIVVGDLLQPESLAPAMSGVQVAYYLVHSMAAPGRFEELDRRAATNFAKSAREAGVRHIVYLSGLARSAIFEIGGDDLVTYGEVMREYARQRKLRRRVVPLPRQTLRASRFVLGMLTPMYGRVAAAMVDSLRNETVVHDSAAREAFAVKPRGLSEAIQRALVGEDHEFAETSWSDVLAATPSSRWGGTPVRRRLVSSRVERVPASPHEAFAPIQRIGGKSGWYAADWFWCVRGLLDRLRGGHGLRRGRRHPHDLHVGDPVDFWRVERVQSDRRLLLAAEMKMPGRLWLQFDVEATGRGTEIRQTTVFDPAGYVGLAYWYLLYPVHHAIFKAMLRGLQRVTQSTAAARPTPPTPGHGVTKVRSRQFNYTKS